MVYEWFGLKTTWMVFSGLTLKSVAQIFWFGPQNRHLRFGDLCLKITATIYWFGSQNQAIFSLSVTPQNRRSENGVRHASRSGGLLHLEASRAMVYQSGLKTGGGTTMCGVHGTIVEVASGSSWRRTSRYDGLRQILLPLLYHFLYIRP
jgi:hypothetical protein